MTLLFIEPINHLNGKGYFLSVNTLIDVIYHEHRLNFTFLKIYKYGSL